MPFGRTAVERVVGTHAVEVVSLAGRRGDFLVESVGGLYLFLAVVEHHNAEVGGQVGLVACKRDIVDALGRERGVLDVGQVVASLAARCRRGRCCCCRRRRPAGRSRLVRRCGRCGCPTVYSAAKVLAPPGRFSRRRRGSCRRGKIFFQTLRISVWVHGKRHISPTLPPAVRPVPGRWRCSTIAGGERKIFSCVFQ